MVKYSPLSYHNLRINARSAKLSGETKELDYRSGKNRSPLLLA